LNSKQEESKLKQDILVFSILIIGTLLALLYIPAFLMKRAIAEVRRIFDKHGAIGVENAKTVDELGLAPPGLVGRLTKPRDYKPHALRYLKQAGEVLVTGDGKLYMLKEQRNERPKESRLELMKRRLSSLHRPGPEK
jgi:hypothetical protein